MEHSRLVMEVACTLEFTYPDEEKAKDILKTVEVDNYGFVEAVVDGSKIVSNIQAKNLKSLLHTLDDYLSCITIAEKIAEV
jgi:tRNA threonylcarbamoyladenosine modification (KEOPS) complex  Pcc1 subunit